MPAMSAQPIADGITEAFKAGYAKASIESDAKIVELEKACAEFEADARRWRFVRRFLATIDRGEYAELYFAEAPFLPHGQPNSAIDAQLAALSASRAGGQGEGK